MSEIGCRSDELNLRRCAVDPRDHDRRGLAAHDHAGEDLDAHGSPGRTVRAAGWADRGGLPGAVPRREQRDDERERRRCREQTEECKPPVQQVLTMKLS
jgi:hypothetical protein